MKILLPLLTLVQLSNANASLVAIMDSGTDISHKDLVSKVWVNKNEKAGIVDLDHDGLPGDINGWDFIENSARVFNPQYNNLITADVKMFFDYASKADLGLLNRTSPELLWLQTHSQDKDLMNKVNFVGGYIHGTHVAGISTIGNPKAKIISFKMIPTFYQELPKNPTPAPKPVDPKGIVTPGLTVSEFTAELVHSAVQKIDDMEMKDKLLAFHKVDVVNQSFGIGFGDAQGFITEAFVEEVKRQPTPAELDTLTRAFFAKLVSEGPRMFNAAPNTVFCVAAGNDSSNNDRNPDFPASIPAANKIVVAATLGYKSLASFSNFGPTKVDVAAPGVAITSTAPTNAYIPLSGTSQATPYVTNMIASMKDINPALSARDLKAIVLGTVDVKEWLRGRVVTNGIVNRPRALKAAELAKVKNITLAISEAKATIADVPVEKSFLNSEPVDLGFKFKPIRPVLDFPKF